RGVGDAEEVEEELQCLAELPVEEQEPPGDLLARDSVAVPLADAEIAAHDLQDGEERDHLPVRHAVRLVDGEAAGTAALGELVAEPALADSGLGDHAHHLALTVERTGEGRLEGRHLVRSPNEAREAAGT